MRPARALVVLAAFAVGGCGLKSTPATHTSPSPAKVEKLPLESEIARITLTEAAQKRLGITLVPVTRERVTRRRVFGGEVTIPAGKAIIVSAGGGHDFGPRFRIDTATRPACRGQRFRHVAHSPAVARTRSTHVGGTDADGQRTGYAALGTDRRGRRSGAQ